MEKYIKPLKKSDNVKRQAHILRDTVLLGDWQEVQSIPSKSINRDLKDEILDGIVIKGYEMRWDAVNENREKYDTTAFDEFIKTYFVERGLNMPVDINHQGFHDWLSYCGRVLYIEANSVGFYFVVYIPRNYTYYERLLWCLRNGIIQGFSKEGFVDYDDYDYIYNEDGSFAYEIIHKMKIISVSLVTTPANGIPFEQVRTTNALLFENKTDNQVLKEDF